MHYAGQLNKAFKDDGPYTILFELPGGKRHSQHPALPATGALKNPAGASEGEAPDLSRVAFPDLYPGLRFRFSRVIPGAPLLLPCPSLCCIQWLLALMVFNSES